MRIRIRGTELIVALELLVTRNQIINFTIDRGKLLLEVFDPVILSIPVEVLSIDKAFEDDDSFSISIELNTSYWLIDPQMDVTVSIGKEILTIESINYSYRFRSVYEDRFVIPTIFSGEYNNLDSGPNLENVVRCGQAMATFTKYLQVEEPAIIVNKETAYIITTANVLITSLHFPDSTWSKSVLRAINAILKKNHIGSPTLSINNESGAYGVINFGDGADIAFNMKFTNSTQIDAVNGVITSLKEVCSVNIAGLSSRIKLVEKIYKKAEVKVVFGENSYYVIIRSGADGELVFGKQTAGDMVYALDASVPLLTLINTIFKTSTNVSVFVGGRYLCLKDNENVLLTTGLLNM